MAHHVRIGGKLNRSHGGNAVIFILLIVVGIFMALPMYYNIITSFKPASEMFIFPPRFYVTEPTIRNYRMMMQLMMNLEVPFTRYLFNSLFVALLSTFLGSLIGAVAAYPFAKKEFPGKKFFWQLIMITLLFTGGVTSLPTYIVKAKLGLINSYASMIVPSLATTLHLFLMRQFMLQIPDSLLEAARIDGASEFRTFMTVVLPNIKPAWTTVLVLKFISLWNTGSVDIYDEQLKLLPTALSQMATGTISRQGATAAATVVMMLPPIVSFFVTQSKMLQTMAHSGIKG
ncbi:MAG: carbohydrate ABC transporter permease [Lachnospiraceae bacterium]|nr:carbohydrate ABC transporter permease [Lachnospiraceae bacterium]